MLLTKEILDRIHEWTEPPYDEATRREISRLLESDAEKELYDRFYTDLEFGTGGLRGIMGAGLNRMNRYVVARATQGLANYLRKSAPDSARLSVVIAYDSRHNSSLFAQEAASVCAANDIKAYLFEELRPTPELSFAVRHLKASAGIMITASHNPKEYNGYKAYWSDGCQVIPPHDKGIIREVKALADPSSVRRADYQQAILNGRIVPIGQEIDQAFLDAVHEQTFRPDITTVFGDRLSVLYTPLHGAGMPVVPMALKKWGFQKVYLCESQATPDGDFTHAPSPNPEEEEALQAAIKAAQAVEAHLVLATDPDCDRVGVAVRHGDSYVLLTGNQVAALLVEYVLASLKDKDALPENGRVVKTIVTSELIAAICEAYGIRMDNVLTGFKYIGEKISQYEESGDGRFLVGGEESYGYLVGTHARDKDAVVCSCLIAEMAAESLSRNETLIDRLDEMQRRLGVYMESLMSVHYPGAEGNATIGRIMESLRNDPPSSFLGTPLVRISDYFQDIVKSFPENQVIGSTKLPRSNVLVFQTKDGTQIIARPSGTEPKIKFYFKMCDTRDLPITDQDALQSRRKSLGDRQEKLRKELANHIQKIAGQKK